MAEAGKQVELESGVGVATTEGEADKLGEFITAVIGGDDELICSTVICGALVVSNVVFGNKITDVFVDSFPVGLTKGEYDGDNVAFGV